jgi:hypothetical protein
MKQNYPGSRGRNCKKTKRGGPVTSWAGEEVVVAICCVFEGKTIPATALDCKKTNTGAVLIGI